MGTPTSIADVDGHLDDSKAGTGQSASHEPPPLWCFLAVAIASMTIVGLMSRRVFLFWDDYLFLGDASKADLTGDYLSAPLFTHFSPVVRLVNWLAVGHIAEYPWLVPAILLTLLACVIASSSWLMVVLFGRTWTALAGAVILGPSLALLPLGNWWTAGINLLPAIMGCQVAFACTVLIVRGRSLWWAVPCLVGIVVGVLDYELAMLMPGYLGLWVLFFHRRVTGASFGDLLRRTWWLWVALVAVSAASLLNYRLNYYSEVRPPSLADGVDALAISLFRNLIPTALGFHDPKLAWFSTVGIVVGLVLVSALLVMTVIRRKGAWLGWVFAVAGWLAPTLALVLNRVSLFGTSVADNAIYFYFPTMLFVVGVLEATRAPLRRADHVGGRSTSWPTARWTALIAGVVIAVGGVAYVRSAPPTAAYQIPYGASNSFVDTARASAAALGESVGDFSVIDADVPPSLVPKEFGYGSNRASNVLGITVPDLRFDSPDGPHFLVDESGNLLPAQIDSQFEVVVEPGSAEGLFSTSAVDDLQYVPGRGACFTARADSNIEVRLPEPVVGDRLVVNVAATVDRPTDVRLQVEPADGSGLSVANEDGHRWYPDQAPRLETVAAQAISSLKFNSLMAGTQVCVSSLTVGNVRKL